MNRRDFLGTMTAATVLARQLAWAADTHKIEKVGLQLYTVRDVMKDDFEGKLAKVAEIGYREVEFAGYENHTPQEIPARRRESSLLITITGLNSRRSTENFLTTFCWKSAIPSW